jgi:hypothetical protein
LMGAAEALTLVFRAFQRGHSFLLMGAAEALTLVFRAFRRGHSFCSWGRPKL